jgi:hypothetical protein
MFLAIKGSGSRSSLRSFMVWLCISFERLHTHSQCVGSSRVLHLHLEAPGREADGHLHVYYSLSRGRLSAVAFDGFNGWWPVLTVLRTWLPGVHVVLGAVHKQVEVDCSCRQLPQPRFGWQAPVYTSRIGILPLVTVQSDSHSSCALPCAEVTHPFG